MTPDQVRLDTRLAGQVTRYHTWPRIREQSVGEHSWQVLRIYSCVATEIDPDFMMYCVYHDTGEIATGDLPYPIKSQNPCLKEEIERLEQDSLINQAHYWRPLVGKGLSDEQLRLFKLIEMVEMFEWGLDEMTRGSTYGNIVAERCLKFVYEKILLAQPLPQAWKGVALYVYKRLLISDVNRDGAWWYPQTWERIAK